MPRNGPQPGGLVSPLDRRSSPFGATATSGDRGWAGLEAACYRGLSDAELDRPPLTHHTFILFLRPPDDLELRCEGVNRHAPPPPGWVSFVPAGVPSRWRWRGRKDSLHVFLEPALLSRVAAEAFDLDPARAAVPPFDGLRLPPLRTALLAVGDELTAEAGGRLAAESLANLLAVQLLRTALVPRAPKRGPDGPLPRAKLRAALEYIEEHLDGAPTLERVAAAAHLSPYHFARLFKAATGVPPHRYVIGRRVERARELLRTTGLPLAEVALCTGFSDQSQLCHHFKRAVGVTPGQFRKSARIA